MTEKDIPLLILNKDPVEANLDERLLSATGYNVTGMPFGEFDASYYSDAGYHRGAEIIIIRTTDPRELSSIIIQLGEMYSHIPKFAPDFAVISDNGTEFLEQYRRGMNGLSSRFKVYKPKTGEPLTDLVGRIVQDYIS
ncbi:hypothetical protein JXC34_04370 [Candidatus Woesearchaeota archaeon]|nr:hypothetical protein [Candidatus Woesearchaeota archaeon]